MILLYGSLTDYDFQPQTSTGAIVRKQADPRGRVPARETCPDCVEGTVRRRGIPYVCDRCEGRAWIKVDAYTRRPIGSEETGTVSDRRWVICDSCGGGAKGRAPGVHANGHPCRRCQDSGRPGHVQAGPPIRFTTGNTRVEVELALDETDPVFRCLAQRKLAGSYDELIAATRELRSLSEHGYRLIAGTYIERRQEPGSLSDQLRRRLDAALHFVVLRMPEPIRVPSRVRAQQRKLKTAA